MSVTFDSVEILNTTYTPRFVKHETAPDRSPNAMALAREDGDVLISHRYGQKIIQLQGTLRASTQANLDTAIDTFKELFSRPEKNLDISWEAGSRRYVATCTKHHFDRDHYHTNAVPWTAEFTVTTGVGVATSATTLVNAVSISTVLDANDYDAVYETSFTFEGSAEPKPIITLELDTGISSSMRGIEYTNLDTGERIIITRNVDWSAKAGKQIVIDCLNKRVMDDLSSDELVEGSFYGVFPTFQIGENNIRIRSGGIVNQQTDEPSLPYPNNGELLIINSTNDYIATRFQIPNGDATFAGALAVLAYTGSTSGSNVFFRLVNDLAGEPDYAGATLLSGTFPHADVPGFGTWVYTMLASSSLADLDPHTPYWFLVGMQGGVDVSNTVVWNADETISIPFKGASVSSDGGTSWTSDAAIPAFKIIFGGVPSAADFIHTVEYTKRFL